MRTLLAACALALCGLAGCGPQAAPGQPWVTDLEFQGQAPRNALVMLFSFRFEDSDGDLGTGTLRPLVNGHDTGDQPLDLIDLMLASGVALDATAGQLNFELEVDMDLDPATRPAAGSTFDVGIEVVDAANNVSNHPSVTLKIEYR